MVCKDGRKKKEMKYLIYVLILFLASCATDMPCSEIVEVRTFRPDTECCEDGLTLFPTDTIVWQIDECKASEYCQGWWEDMRTYEGGCREEILAECFCEVE